MSIKRDENLIRRRATYRVLLFFYDIFSVNFAYFMAVLIRFSDADSYHLQGIKYMQMFKGFAPWYSLVCVWLFVLLKLYSGVWRYVGLNDFRRIFIANVLSSIVYICGSLIIVGRMPVSVYILGTGIQFIMMSIVRVAPRYIIENYRRTSGDSDMTIPLMIVGVGENARIIQNKIARDKSNIVNPVCVVDDGNTFRGNTFNGLPVFCGVEAVPKCVEKYDIRCAVIAEWNLSTEFTDMIRRICKEKSIELREFLIGTDKGVNEVEIRKVLDLIKGPVRVIRDGLEDKIYPDSKSALRSYSEDCVVDSLSPSDGEIVIHIHHTELAKPVASEEWIRKYREETGDEISFF